MNKITATMLAVAVAGLVLAGCSKPAAPPAEPPKTDAPATPSANSTTFSGKSADGKVEAKLVVAGKVASVEMVAPGFTWNATFASKTPKDPKNKDGEGHAILTLDTKEPMYAGTMRTALTELDAGKHTLKVQLVQNDNTAVTEATVSFEVK